MRRLLLLTALAAAVGGVTSAGAAAPSAIRDPVSHLERSADAPHAPPRRRRVGRSHVATDVVSVVPTTEEPLAPAPTPRIAADSWSGLPLTVVVVDGETGAPLGGTVRLARTMLASATRARIPESARDRIGNARLRFDGSAHRLEHSFAEPDTWPRLRLDVEPPDGYILAATGPVERRVKISRFARSLRVTVPVRRVVEVELDIRAESGHRVTRQLREIVVYVGGERYVVTTYAPHRVRVPFLRGEEFYALVRTCSSWAEVRVPLVDAPRMTVPVRVPRRRAGWSNAGHYRGPCGSVPQCGWEVRWDGSATLDVWVRRFAGSPAAGIRVHLEHRTDGRVHDSATVSDEGRARFTGLPAGDYSLSIAEPGFVTTTARLELETGEARTLTVDEDPGVSCEIQVRNSHGLPLPFARVLIENGEHYSGLDPDGTQQLDHHTDANGRCEIARMSPSPIYVSVHWAGAFTSGLWTPGEPLHVTTRERVYLTER